MNSFEVTYPHLLFLAWIIIFITFSSYMLKKLHFSTKQKLFIIFLVLIWSFPLIRSGLPTKYGLGFWGPNGHDAIWHLGLTQSILNGLPFKHPTLAGQVLTNYHFGYDLILALLHLITRLPLTFLYFQILPPIIALTILILSHKLYIKTFNTTKGVWFSLFFIVMTGSLGFIVSAIKHQPLGGESAFWANQAISTLINPPFATSLIFILVTILLILKRQKSFLDYLFIFILPAITLWFKVYGGLFLVTIIGFWTITQIITNPKSIKKIILPAFIGTLAFIVSIKALTGSQSLIVFKPFWFITNMFIFTDRVGWLKFGQALTTYLQSTNPKLFIALPVALFIFYLGNFGIRIISVFSLKHLNSHNRNLLIPLWLTIIVFSLIPLFIIQKGTPWNSIQFLYYPLFFTAFLSGSFFINLNPTLKFSNFKLKIKNLVIMIIIMMTIPTTISTLSYYTPKIPHAILPWEEVKALQFLSRQPKGDIITPPFNPHLKDTYNNPIPLFAYTDTAYVVAFSGKTTYLADTMNLDISGYNYQQRQDLLKKLYDPTLPDSYKNQILTTITKTNPNIKYIYILHLPTYKLTPPPLWHKIYQNSLVEVWKK